MTLPDPNLEREVSGPNNIQDRVPPTERGADPEREAMSSALTTDVARPLTSDEKKAAEHDTPVAEPVYAPASERVPKEPVPGHRDMLEHVDPDTPERHAAASGTPATAAGPSSSSGAAEVSGAYPGASAAYAPAAGARLGPVSTVDTPTPSPYATPETNPGYAMPESWATPSSPWWSRPAAWLVPPACVGVAIFVYLRWRRERNKPINRIRRQAGRQANRARKAADDLRGRVPNTSDVAQPTMGLLAAMASTALVLSRRARSDRMARQAREAVSEADWQQRLLKLKERWTPHRLELEKFSISRH